MRVATSNRYLLLAAIVAVCFWSEQHLRSQDSGREFSETELAAASSHQSREAGGETRLWPETPTQPGIRFLKTIPEQRSEAKTLFGRLKGLLFSQTEESGMVRPMGLATDGSMLYVTDPGAEAYFIVDLEKGSVKKIASAGDDLLVSPVGIELDKNRVLVSDSQLGKILVYNRRGRFLKTFTTPGLERPTGLALDKESGSLYVTDTTRHQVLVFDQQGELIRSFGERGTKEGQFNYPTHLWLDRHGQLLVVDSLNYRVQRFDSDGRFLGAFGQQGDGSGDFASPKGIATDTSGHIYVVDALFDSVQIFDGTGQLLLPFGGRGREPGRFYLPTGLYIDEQNRIYVADSYNHRIQVFEFLGDPSSGD